LKQRKKQQQDITLENRAT